MSLGDFRVIDTGDGPLVARRYQTKGGQTAIVAGEMVVQDTAGDVEYVLAAVDGAADSATWVGMALSNDTVTASVDGEVFVADNSNYIFRGLATTPANLASTVILTKVTLDVTASKQTVDENDTTNGTLLIRNFNATDGTVDVSMSQSDHISD